MGLPDNASGVRSSPIPDAHHGPSKVRYFVAPVRAPARSIARPFLLPGRSMPYERILLIVVAACVLRPAEARAAEPSDVWSSVDPSRVCAVASVWHLGVGAGRVPNEMIETAVPMEVDG